MRSNSPRRLSTRELLGTSLRPEWSNDLSRVHNVRSQVGDLKKSDIPGTDALHQPGKKEGDVKVVKTDSGVVEAYQVRSLLSPCSQRRD